MFPPSQISIPLVVIEYCLLLLGLWETLGG
jgi:hypothetical protein